MIALLFASLVAAAEAPSADDGFRMNDLGGTVYLPVGWKSKGWADWELKSESGDGAFGKVWLTPFQVDVTPESMDAWATMHKKQALKEGLTQVEITDKQIVELAGRKTAHIELSFRIDGKMPGVAYVDTFTGDGQTIHVRTVAARRRAAKARAALDHMVETMKLDHGPEDTVGPELSSDAGFAVTMPDGWRAPLAKEVEAVSKIAAKVGQKKLDAEHCWVALRPPPVGDPDVMFACRTPLYLGPLDEYSFKGIEPQLHQRYFGSSGDKVPPGEPIDVDGRMGVFFSPPEGAIPMRLGLAPYDGGLMVLWGLGGQLDDAGVDAAARAALSTVKFTGPDGGAPIIGADKRVGYYLRYRTLSLPVLGPLFGLIALVGGLITWARGRRRRRYDDL